MRGWVNDEIPSVLERMTRPGIAEDRALDYLRAGSVLVDGERVTDPCTPAPPPARIVLLPT